MRNVIQAVTVAAVLGALMPASAGGPAVTEARFGNGMRLMLLENHKLPTIHFSIMFKGAGSVMDPPGKQGLASITGELLREGTKTRTAQQLANQVDFLGASLGAYAESERAMVSASALSRDTATILELLADVTLRPTFKAEEVERVKGRRVASLTQLLDNADAVASRAFYRFLLGRHPYGQPGDGYPKSMAAITPQDVAAFHAAHYRADNAVMVVAGDFSPEKLLPQLEAAFNTFKPGKAPAVTPAPEPSARQARILLLDKPDLTQAKIVMGHVGIPREHADYYAVAVMNGVLGGTGFLSRLMGVVRSKLGLTYGIGSTFDARRAGGAFTISLSTKVESAAAAIGATFGELDRLQAGGATPKELVDVQNYMTGTFALSQETPEGQASQLLYADLHNQGIEYLRLHPQRIRDVKAADVSRAAQAYVSKDMVRVVVVGPAEKLKDSLATLGNVEIRPHTAWADDGE